MFACAAEILGIQANELSDEVIAQLGLPVRMGGCGLTNWSLLRKIAYDCSVAGATKQQSIQTQAFHETRIAGWKSTNPDFAKHLENCTPRMASYWLNSPISFGALQSSQFSLSLLLRLRWQTKSAQPATVACKCGFPHVNSLDTFPRDILIHQLGCSNFGGPTDRHHYVVRTLQALLLSCNFNAQLETPLGPGKRMDIRAERDALRLYIDVTVANAECRSHRNKSFDKLFAEKDAAKHKAYKEAAAADGYTLHTFFIDTFGKMDSKSLELLKMLWAITRDDPRQEREKPLPLSEVLAPFSEAIAKGNAQCVWKVHMLKAFGIDTSKAKWRRKATGPAPTEESPSSAAEGNGSDDTDDTYESSSVDDDSAAANGDTTSSPPPSFSPPPPNCKSCNSTQCKCNSGGCTNVEPNVSHAM